MIFTGFLASESHVNSDQTIREKREIPEQNNYSAYSYRKERNNKSNCKFVVERSHGFVITMREEMRDNVFVILSNTCFDSIHSNKTFSELNPLIVTDKNRQARFNV